MSRKFDEMFASSEVLQKARLLLSDVVTVSVVALFLHLQLHVRDGELSQKHFRRLRDLL